MTHDPDRVIVLIQVPTETEAVVIVACLEEQGIQAHVTGALTSGFRAEVPGNVQVLVRAADLENARAALTASVPRAAASDESNPIDLP